MINPNNSSYIREREEFHSDKCGHCMSYVDVNGDCTNNLCSGLIPDGLCSLSVVKVFFETAGYAEEFCTYTNEAEYIADLPRLEKLAREMGYDYVTETIE